MTKVHSLFLYILHTALAEQYKKDAVWQYASETNIESVSAETMTACLNLSEVHVILPLIYEQLLSFPSICALSLSQQKHFKARALHIATRQIIQTNEFLTLILHAQKQGLDPIVVKGVTVRNLYPQPCLRPSVDEDLLIPAEEMGKWHRFLLSEGLFADNPSESHMISDGSVPRKLDLAHSISSYVATTDLSSEDLKAATEFSYHKENSPTYIELHKTLFDPQSDAYGDFNELFPDVFDHTVRIQIEDVSVRTLEPSYHFLYLILHAFKHFVHSGIGIRAVCDIGMFAEHYRNEIDWGWIRESLEKVNAFTFARGILRIVQKYLMPEAAFFDQIKGWCLEDLDIEPLLEDILASGVHGASSLTRLHSSNITLQAVANQKKSQAISKGSSRHKPISRGTLKRTLFPSAKRLAGRYTYLKKMPVLLPVAWGQRAAHYLAESRNKHAVSDAAESLRLGEARIRLLKQYGIIQENN